MILSTKCESLELLWYVLSHVQYNVLNYFSCSICLNYIFFLCRARKVYSIIQVLRTLTLAAVLLAGLVIVFERWLCCLQMNAAYAARMAAQGPFSASHMLTTGSQTRKEEEEKRVRRGGARTKAGHHFAGLECNAFSGERWHGKYSLCRYGFALHRILGLFCGQINAAAGGRRTRARMSATRSRCMYF